jgi:hypothetical protein
LHLNPRRDDVHFIRGPDVELGYIPFDQRMVTKLCAKVGRDVMVPSNDSSFSGTVQDRDLLKLLTRKLHGFNLDIIADAEFVDGDELIATFQPGPWSDR